MITKRKYGGIIFLVLILILSLTGCRGTKSGLGRIKGNETTVKSDVDYSDTENWAYYEEGASTKKADIFFVCPTVYLGEEGIYQMSMEDTETKADFLGATNMEKGIYDENARFFAPYYKQAALNVYELQTDEREQYLSLAYADIKAAFEYYLKQCNDGRPIVLAGFSQGADMCIRLMKDYSNHATVMKQMVACYAIGWSITDDEIKAYPKLKFAQGESDTGVIVSFNSEAEDIDDSLMIPKGIKTLAINPLNWKTDGTVADKSLNMGACFTDYSGKIMSEIPELTGAYIDDVRGALKVTDVTATQYPAVLPIFKDGIFHLYDYQFFYRNLENNVNTRIAAYNGETWK